MSKIFYIYDNETGNPLGPYSDKRPKLDISIQITNDLRANPTDITAHANNVAYLLMQECNVNKELLNYLKRLGADNNELILYLNFEELEHIKSLIKKNPKTSKDLAFGINNEINQYLRLKFPSKSISFLKSDSDLESGKPKLISNCPSRDKTPSTQKDYKDQLLIFHPDKNRGCIEDATEKFKFLQQIFKKTNGGKKQTNKKRYKNKNKSKTKTRKNFLYNPKYPKKSFDVYIDKNPDDTISIKYTTIKDVKDTILKLEKLYKDKKYSHKRIWQVGMIMKVRLEVLKNKKPEQYNLSKKYFEFLVLRTKLNNNDRYKTVFKF